MLGLVPMLGTAQAPPPAPAPQAPAATAPAQEPGALVTRTPSNDPLLERLIAEALDHSPDLARSRHLADAEKERVPQATALPDPSLSLGLQNDGFKKLQIGMMEGSYYQIMATQPLPWPGKRDLRGQIAKLGVEIVQTDLKRAASILTAEVQRAYYGLLLVRGQRELLDQQAQFWRTASELTRVRYEVGQGTQADLLRAQLEQTRLRQARLGLDAAETGMLAALNRLRGAAADTPVPTTARLEDARLENIPAKVWLERAEMDCCELLDARLLAQQAERVLALAKRDRYPDLAVTAGIMPRGSLDTMWQAGVSVSLPIWSGQKQKRAVSEQELRRRASDAELRNLRSQLAQRILERNAQMEAALETIRLYREGLLVQSEASFQATLAQYEAGRTPFLGVLEALNGWLADRSGYLQALASAHAVHIAQEEFNLAGTPPIAVPGLSSGTMGMGGSPGGAAMPSTTARPSSAGGAAPAAQGGSPMKSM
jgi:outer membrane protein TolC